MRKKIIKLFLLGLLLGIAACSLVTTLTCDAFPASPAFVDRIGDLRTALLVQLLISALYGAVCMGSTVLYDVDRLPLSLTSLIHCLICIVPFLFISNFLCWVEGTAQTLIMAGAQLAAYFVVWLVLYLIYRKQTKELNDIQNQKANKSTPSE